MKFFHKLIEILFYLLFFLLPLILWPFSYELFEFNKIITIYVFTVLIVFAWASKSIIERKIIFRRTILDVPLILFLTSQILSTIVSVDPRTSIFGFYSRFNGGLLSLISFSLLYWAFVSNFDKIIALNSTKSLISSLILVSVYGILEHFGIDKNIWVQDVAERVFSTLGQPNWLGAFIVATIPMTHAFMLKARKQSLLMGIVSIIFFITLLYTKSRSAFLGFIFASLIFWSYVFISKLKSKDKELKKKTIGTMILINAVFIILNLSIKTPWTPNILNVINKNSSSSVAPTPAAVKSTALESGGTESGTIRKLVWQGAIDIWKEYPILGSGVETFAFSFYKTRPKEHNLVSEWDFLYNKAHNEYLNFLATTGTIGFISYITLIVFIIIVFVKNIKKDEENRLFHLALLAGFGSILVTSFFGFSVAVVNLQFFIYPAISIALNRSEDERTKEGNISNTNKTIIFLLLFATFILLISISHYWLADLNYANGKRLNDAGMFSKGREKLISAIKYSSKEALFWSELSENSADLAVALKENKNEENSKKIADSAIMESKRAEDLSPRNIGVLRQVATTYLKLSQIDGNYLYKVKEYLEKAIELSPNDAKLYYNLGILYDNSNEPQKAVEIIEKAIELKSNYKQARYKLATLYLENNESEKAKTQLKYILENIDPNDNLVKQQLEKI